MITCDISFNDLDRETLRLIIAAFRDKLDQCSATFAKTGDPVVGEQMAFFGNAMSRCKEAYAAMPTPKTTFRINGDQLQ